jgi:hypothetical protein
VHFVTKACLYLFLKSIPKEYLNIRQDPFREKMCCLLLGVKPNLTSRESQSQIRRVLYLTHFLCEPMRRIEIFHTISLLVEIEGHFTYEFVTYRYVFGTQDRLVYKIC